MRKIPILAVIAILTACAAAGGIAPVAAQSKQSGERLSQVDARKALAAGKVAAKAKSTTLLLRNCPQQFRAVVSSTMKWLVLSTIGG